MINKKECVAMLLAGGQGSRLFALTNKIAKPAVTYIPLYERNVLIYGVRRTLEPLRSVFRLIGRKNMYAAVRAVEIPRLAVTDIIV